MILHSWISSYARLSSIVLKFGSLFGGGSLWYATKLTLTRIFFFEILFLLCIQDIFKTCFTFFTVQCLPHVPLPSQHTVGIDVSCRSRLVGWCLDSVATLQPRAQFSVASPAGCVEELQTLYPSDTPRERSHTVSGRETWGPFDSTGWLIAITRSLKSSLRRSQTAVRWWAGTPSWAHHT